MESFVKKIAEKNGTLERVYGDLVNAKVRRRYSEGDEIALALHKEEKAEEVKAHDLYVEQCKQEARKELGII